MHATPNYRNSFAVSLTLLFLTTLPLNSQADNNRTQSIVKHWTQARITQAIPRDLFIDKRGQAYLRHANGMLHSYGHKQRQLKFVNPEPVAKPAGNGNDSTAPQISNMQPGQDETIGDNYLFSATITDANGIKSVSFVIVYPDGVSNQVVNPVYVGNDRWETQVDGFSNGNWSWYVVATDSAKKGGNTSTSESISFIVDTSGGTASYIITNDAWAAGGAIQTASGRIYFEMPSSALREEPWTGYVCSGTVVTDNISGRSIILTAAHCVYDDKDKAFSRNVLFIPDQSATTGSGTDLDCNNDPLGCWTPAFGMVDSQWVSRVFPNNKEWDYGYYVVNDSGAHTGTLAISEALDVAAGSLAVNFLPPYVDDGDPSATSVDYTNALGYSYAMDPNFMYCAQDMTTNGVVNWWLADCGLTGGSSGGPWVQPMDMATGSGPIISLNSWRYTSSPGMAGPKLSSTSAGCIFVESQSVNFSSVPITDGDAGVVIDYCP